MTVFSLIFGDRFSVGVSGIKLPGNILSTSAFLLTLGFISGCTGTQYLAPVPNIYKQAQTYPTAGLSQKTTEPSLLYITDRQLETTERGLPAYGSKRSDSMALGEARITFDAPDWDTIVRASSGTERVQKIALSLTGIKEQVRFPETPLPFSIRNGKPVLNNAKNIAYQKAVLDSKTLLQQRIKASQKKEVLLFVHGFNNTFEDSAIALADIWHFAGRNSVPVFYSWPAANGGPFGYFRDRESGEFSIYHLKESIRLIAQTPSLKKLHIVAHSRGTDMVTTALRELFIEARAAGINPRTHYKIQNLILAAPDLDFGVVSQRIIAEKVGLPIGNLTVYINQADKALQLSQYLMQGVRFGTLRHEDLGTNTSKIFDQLKSVNFINTEGVKLLLGHSYYHHHPGVLSDIVLLLNSGAAPGSTQRPLKNTGGNFWTLSAGYPVASP